MPRVALRECLGFFSSLLRLNLRVFELASKHTQDPEERPVHDTPKLTDRQQQILDLVRNTIATTGAPPTRAEIAQTLGFRSPNAAEDHLQALARKGAIELVEGTSRGIRLPAHTLLAVNQQRLQQAHGPTGGQKSRQTGEQMSFPLPSLAQLNLPLIGRVAAGSPILAQEHIEQTYALQASLFTRRPDYLLKVRGMSMRDAGILDGDLLAVHRTQEAKNGQIVVARLGDEVTVKRFRRTQQGIELIPENPDFQTLLVSTGSDAEDMQFELEGLAVGLIRNGMAL
jgi:repressor LexA